MKYLFLIAFLFILPSHSHAYAATLSVKFASSTNQFDSIVKGSSTNLYTTGDFAWESWVKFTSLPGAGSQEDLYGQSWQTGGNLSFLIQLDNTAGTFGIRFREGSAGGQDKNIVVATFSPTIATWMHLALVYTAASGTAEVFKDGVSLGSNSTFTTSIFNGTDPVRVGQSDGSSGASATNGQFSLMRLWTTTRTAAQLSGNWCAKLGSTSNLGAEWVFDNNHNDNSGNSNTLTANNSPTFTVDVPSPTGCPISSSASALWFPF